MNRTLAATLVAMASMSACSTPPAQLAPSAINAAVADPARPANDTRRDESRHPDALLAFSRVKAGDRVVDVWPGGGYWTRLFSTLVGSKGQVIGFVPGEVADDKSDPVGLVKKITSEPGHGNVEASSHLVSQQPAPAMQGTVDVVWVFENYHDLHDDPMKPGDVDAFNAAVFKLLKPNGVYVIGDHAAAAGASIAVTDELHRIDPAVVRAEVEKAGFVFDGPLDVLANPGDDHHLRVFDPAIRGKTDRFVMRFRKPA